MCLYRKSDSYFDANLFGSRQCQREKSTRTNLRRATSSHQQLVRVLEAASTAGRQPAMAKPSELSGSSIGPGVTNRFGSSRRKMILGLTGGNSPKSVPSHSTTGRQCDLKCCTQSRFLPLRSKDQNESQQANQGDSSMFTGYFQEVRIVAEVKPHSPKGQRTTQLTDSELLRLAIKTGDTVSLHTHPLWNRNNRSFEVAADACHRAGRKVLAKGFHGSNEEIEHWLKQGADFVLTVGFMPRPGLREKCFIEPLTLKELAQVPGECMAVWNTRDLSSLRELEGIPPYLQERWRRGEGIGGDRLAMFKQARQIHRGLLCHASNLTTIADIQKGANAVLVGSKLEEFAKSLCISNKR